MKIYFDENMPFAKEFFSHISGVDTQLIPFSGRDLTAQTVVDADGLLVRSITQVNEALLSKNNRLFFVGTATIGTDHIDEEYLTKRGIRFYSAPGCNAISVAEYVLSALVVLAERYLLDLFSLTVGIVGGGNTGTRLSEKLMALGIPYKICDPHLEQKSSDKRTFFSLEEVLTCDVISLHVPKVTQGKYPTYRLLHQDNLIKLRDDQILISACRGDVIDNHALLALKKAGHGIKLVLDVWQGEPEVLRELIQYTELATAHIAGYSLEGKARGTELLYRALCQQLNEAQRQQIAPEYHLADFLPSAGISLIEIKQNFNQLLLNQLVKMVYDVRRDDAIFRQQLAEVGFDQIRKTYPVRREFSAVTITGTKAKGIEIIHQLGFSKIKHD